MAEKVQQGEVFLDDINEELIQNHTSLGGIPEPDLCIRTGGEKRISNFLLWQFAYTEFYFSDVYWPDFNEKELNLALHDFAKRQRRFGKVSE